VNGVAGRVRAKWQIVFKAPASRTAYEMNDGFGLMGNVIVELGKQVATALGKGLLMDDMLATFLQMIGELRAIRFFPKVPW